MNISIVKEIFYGNKGHYETIKESKEYWRIMDEAATLSASLEESLSEKQKEIFKKLTFANMGLEAEAALSYFTEGFKLGLLIGIECVDNE